MMTAKTKISTWTPDGPSSTQKCTDDEVELVHCWGQ
ncbi:hypothetical protein CASFOL_008171 [Castilleja foliolosa]|uniref:Uncharacterized protein n=1 Tax=Castilleja foliolosa TaxID=1961234 RepID=A0ABD3DY73_9LAMI